jgi:DtxR family transcriptional regulator, Mn-dependent transcriptional regulator
MNGTVSAAMENYLEAILRLSGEGDGARVRDIAGALSVHKSTVTAALRVLAGRKLINYSPYAKATLTRRGREIAESVARRHSGIRRFLTDVLLVDEDTANENACRMEHVMDATVLDRIDRFMRVLGASDKASCPFQRQFAKRLRMEPRPAAGARRKGGAA